jgi:hypothetical protein
LSFSDESVKRQKNGTGAELFFTGPESEPHFGGVRLEAAAGAVAGPGTHAILFAYVSYYLDRDFAEAFVGIRLGIVSHGVRVA